MSIKERIRSNIANIPGWSPRRKIVVLESDDWGSVRMSSRKDRDELTKYGFDFGDQPFNRYDALESNDDLTALFELLKKHKDSRGRSPLFTAVSIMANPDFEKIKEQNYQRYYYESFADTLKRYSNHQHVFNLYQQGIKESLFYPVLHGREHLNVQRWMRALQAGNSAVLKTFNHGVTAVHLGPDKTFLGDFQAAFDLDTSNDLVYQQQILGQAVTLFKKLFGYDAEYFVPPNGPFNNALLNTLAQNGVRYLLGERIQNEPLGDGRYKKHLHYIGQKTVHNLRYLTRNAMFEPALRKDKVAEVGNCLKSIERAFRWGKPAVICSHRVNYIGYIDESNRTENLKQLNQLLASIITRWPDVEFMNSVELGNLMDNGK